MENIEKNKEEEKTAFDSDNLDDYHFLLLKLQNIKEYITLIQNNFFVN